MRRKLTRMIFPIGGRLAAFTITEVIVASVLLLVAIVPILKALTAAHVSDAVVERKTRSLILAQAKLNEIKARSIHNYTGAFMEMYTSLDGSYLCCVRDIPQTPDLRLITVFVGYDLNGNSILAPDEVEATLATYLAKRSAS